LRVDPIRRRKRMIDEQIIARGICDERVLGAMMEVPRHLFVDEAMADNVYQDKPLPIGEGQTISQPYVVAKMTEALDVQPGMTVLEIGTGSGYQAAVLSRLAKHVYTIERINSLHRSARGRFLDLKYFNITAYLDDGTLGKPDLAPYDRIMVTAGGPKIPMALVRQLADPGKMIIPVGATRGEQQLVLVEVEDGEIFKTNLGPVEFVDLVGKFGW